MWFWKKKKPVNPWANVPRSLSDEELLAQIMTGQIGPRKAWRELQKGYEGTKPRSVRSLIRWPTTFDYPDDGTIRLPDDTPICNRLKGYAFRSCFPLDRRESYAKMFRDFPEEALPCDNEEESRACRIVWQIINQKITANDAFSALLKEDFYQIDAISLICFLTSVFRDMRTAEIAGWRYENDLSDEVFLFGDAAMHFPIEVHQWIRKEMETILDWCDLFPGTVPWEEFRLNPPAQSHPSKAF